MKLRGEQLTLSGTLATLDLFGVISGSANFAVSKQLVDVDLDGSGTQTAGDLDDATLVTIALSAMQLDVAGVLSITGGSLAIVGLTPKKLPLPTTVVDTRKWSVLAAKEPKRWRP